jgi:hypothetical protein
MMILLSLVLAGVVAIGALLFQLTTRLAAILDTLSDIRAILLARPRLPVDHHVPIAHWGHQQHSWSFSMGYFTLWEWQIDARGVGEWQLKSTLIPPAIEPGTKPTMPGTHPGQVVKKWVPRRK